MGNNFSQDLILPNNNFHSTSLPIPKNLPNSMTHSPKEKYISNDQNVNLEVVIFKVFEFSHFF